MESERIAREQPKRYKLDSKPYVDKVARARLRALKALEHYGEPTMSLEELRAAVDRALPPGFSLSEFIIKERQSGW